MAEESYIRGASATSVDPRRVAWVLGVLVVLSLVVGAIVFAVGASSNDSTTARLRHHGVPVEATVTSCTGISSGVGMGVEYYDCSGRYSLDGATFVEPIRGSRAQLPPGQQVAALAVPGDPASLALPGSAHSASTGSWATAAALGAGALLVAAVLLVLRRRGRDTPPPTGAGPVPT